MLEVRKYSWLLVSNARAEHCFGFADTAHDAVRNAIEVWDGIPANDYRLKIHNSRSGILVEEKKLVTSVVDGRSVCRWEPV